MIKFRINTWKTLRTEPVTCTSQQKPSWWPVQYSLCGWHFTKLTHLVLISTLWSRYYHRLHFFEQSSGLPTVSQKRVELPFESWSPWLQNLGSCRGPGSAWIGKEGLCLALPPACRCFIHRFLPAVVYSPNEPGPRPCRGPGAASGLGGRGWHGSTASLSSGDPQPAVASGSSGNWFSAVEFGNNSSSPAPTLSPGSLSQFTLSIWWCQLCARPGAGCHRMVQGPGLSDFWGRRHMVGPQKMLIDFLFLLLGAGSMACL